MSAIVTDTHSILWYLNDSAKLSADALAAFELAENSGEPICVPAICLVEVRYLVEKNKDVLESDFQLILSEIRNPNSALTFVPLNQHIVEKLDQIPRSDVPDMPDRVIAATALTLKMPLISKDSKITTLKNIAVIW